MKESWAEPLSSEMMRLVLLFFLFVGVSAAASHATITEKKKELTKIQADIGRVAEDISRIEEERGALLAQLAGIEKQYGKTMASLNTLQDQIALKRQKLQNLSAESGKLQADLREQSRSLSSQIKAAYVMGRREKLKLMFNQQDPALSSRMMIYYQYLNNDRLKALAHIRHSLGRIDELEREKHHEAKQLKLKLSLVQEEQAELSDSRTQREGLLARLDDQYSSSKRKLKRLQDGEQHLQKLLQELQRFERRQIFKPGPSGSFVKAKGRLPWPVEGRVVKKFGSPRLESRWDGVLIAASEGAEIHAVSKGIVVFADWLRGYGLLTIIDHGSGFMTLYAFNQSLFKAVGDQVVAGDIIATVGKSGGRRKAGLYFGIRRKGKPVNPVRWCRK